MPDSPHEDSPSPSARNQGQHDPDRAVKALQQLASPKPRAADASDHEDDKPMSGASGFVGMLAKKNREGFEDDAPHTEPARSSDIPMAREVVPPDGHELPEPHERPHSASTPRRLPQRKMPLGGGVGLVAIMFLLAVMLLAIGGWAIGAVAYMHSVKATAPAEVHYPLIHWDYDTTGVGEDIGDYTPASRTMSYLMTACVPVGLFLVVLGVMYLRRRARSAKLAH